MAQRRGRGKIGWILFLMLLVIPVIEVIVIIQVGRTIGGWQTFGLLVLWSLIGAWLVKSQWRTAWRALRTALQTGRMPARELTDAALILIGGTLLLAPGFLTDIMGLFLILPFTRPLARPLLQAAVARRLLDGTMVGGTTVSTGPTGTPGAGPMAGPRRRPAQDDVIEGEIVDD